MKFTIKLLLLLIFIILYSITQKFAHANHNHSVLDTIIVSKLIPEDISGSLYKEKEYFIVTGKDTSSFSCVFSENKKTELINIKFEYDLYNKKSMTSLFDTIAVTDVKFILQKRYSSLSYKQQINEFKMILQKAVEDFDFNNLHYLFFGVLSSSGDLAISLTNQYVMQFGKDVTDQRVKQFLKVSQLVFDINSCLKPFSILVEDISIEKSYFVSSKELFKTSEIETDQMLVPNSILNCYIYVKLKRL